MATGMVLLKCMFMMVLSVGLVKSDVDKDREECATQLVGLAKCLPYVGGTAKAPTPDCCTGFKQVTTTSKKCICLLIKNRDDPSLALLHLSPNSPDAKVFEDFNNIANGNTTSSSTTPPAASTETPKSGSSNSGSSPQVKNEGGVRMDRWLGLKTVGGFLLWCLT
ncbi:hypothetical protein MKX01_033343 [Papaver californicum]|nr:hypothetical protein MKX01_033343 [Papaver californicum]